jgi:hypothetical protein
MVVLVVDLVVLLLEVLVDHHSKAVLAVVAVVDMLHLLLMLVALEVAQ